MHGDRDSYAFQIPDHDGQSGVQHFWSYLCNWQAVADEDITAIKRPLVSLASPQPAIILFKGRITFTSPQPAIILFKGRITFTSPQLAIILNRGQIAFMILQLAIILNTGQIAFAIP